MSASDVFVRNRVILCHFDSYSALLLFARFGASTLMPSPLSDGNTGMAPPETSGPMHDSTSVMNALAERYGLSSEQLVCMGRFNEWVDSDAGPIRVHLIRIDAFEPPKALIESHEGKFRPISEMRGIPPHELVWVRRTFDIIVGGA